MSFSKPGNYRTRSGQTVTVLRIDDSPYDQWKLKGTDSYGNDSSWTVDGEFCTPGTESASDLVEFIDEPRSEEQEQESAPRRFWNIPAPSAEMNDLDVSMLAQKVYQGAVLSPEIAAKLGVSSTLSGQEACSQVAVIAIESARIFQTEWNTHLQNRRDTNGENSNDRANESGSDGTNIEQRGGNQVDEKDHHGTTNAAAVSEGEGSGEGCECVENGGDPGDCNEASRSNEFRDNAGLC